MKIKASQFMGRADGRKSGEIPTAVVSKRASSGSSKSSKRDTFYNVGSLEAAISTFEENERLLSKR